MPRTGANLIEIRRLYFGEALTVPEIAARLGVTKQAVYERLQRSQIKLNSRLKTVNPDKLRKLYLNDLLPIKVVAERLHTDTKIVSRELVRLGIERRLQDPRRKHPELATMKIGEAFILKTNRGQPPHLGCLYRPAKKLGIRITIRRIDKEMLRVTRLA